MSQSSNKILIIHPEGNINSNPNLYSIVEILSGEGYFIDIYSPKRSNLDQTLTIKNARLLVEDYSDFDSLEDVIKQKYSLDYKLIIGIDVGIIEAALLASLIGVSYGLISYEIFFASEIRANVKQMEIDACKNISFAVVQDEIRGALLCQENSILPEKLIYIPVSGCGYKPYKKKKLWHDHFQISSEKKIALLIGSIDTWTMVDELIHAAKNINDEWQIVIHSKYGATSFDDAMLNKIKNIKNIHISDICYRSIGDMENALHSADLGVAFYKTIENSIYNGKNMQFIGMSSGKVSTYLQHGLPVLISNYEPMATLLTEYEIGYFVQSDIANAFNSIDLFKIKENNIKIFFEKYLDLSHTIKPLLSVIKSALFKEPNIDHNYLSGLIRNNELFHSRYYFIPIYLHNKKLLEIEKDAKIFYKQVTEYKNSESYKLGKFIVGIIKKFRF